MLAAKNENRRKTSWYNNEENRTHHQFIQKIFIDCERMGEPINNVEWMTEAALYIMKKV